MPRPPWIERYPQVKALLQGEDEELDYTPDACLRQPGDAPVPLHHVPTHRGPSLLCEGYWPPMDVFPQLPLTWAMVQDVWPRLVARRF